MRPIATLRRVELPEPGEEGRHPPDPEQPAWEESWDLDFTTADGTLGGYVRLALRPATVSYTHLTLPTTERV